MLKELTEVLSKAEFKQPHFLKAEAEVREIFKISNIAIKLIAGYFAQGSLGHLRQRSV